MTENHTPVPDEILIHQEGNDIIANDRSWACLETDTVYVMNLLDQVPPPPGANLCRVAGVVGVLLMRKWDVTPEKREELIESPSFSQLVHLLATGYLMTNALFNAIASEPPLHGMN